VPLLLPSLPPAQHHTFPTRRSSDLASPSASKPGPRFADVAGMRTWTRTRLQPLEEPVRGEGDGPGVQDHVVVGEDEDSDDDEDDARRPLDHGNEPTITLEEREKRPERRRGDQKR